MTNRLEAEERCPTCNKPTDGWLDRAQDIISRAAANIRTTPAPSQPPSDAIGAMWETLTYVAAASDCEASRAAAKETMEKVEPLLTQGKPDPFDKWADGL